MLALIAAVILSQTSAPAAQPAPATAPSTQRAPEPTAREKVRADAAAVRPLVKHDCVGSFLDAAGALPEVQPRVIYYQPDPKAAFSEEEAAKLPDAQREACRKINVDTARYYDTFYGSPLAYSRALDLCAAAGFGSYSGKRILDYGYGTCGHLRILASLEAEATGVDVDPILRVMYSQPGDQGAIPAHSRSGKPGKLTLVDGFWPGTPKVRADVGAQYDLFISKNTLKNGYVHPAEGVDKRRTLTLGVTDEEFVKALYETLKPGGLAMIYNIGPAPAAPGKPILPHADIRCPFPRALLESSGFKVIEFEKDDTEEMKKFAHALGWDAGKSGMDLNKDLFVSYTLFRKP